MIGFTGLLLVPRRFAEAAAVLERMIEHLRDGLMPSEFPEDGSAPRYLGADVSLWFIQAVHDYIRYTNDESPLRVRLCDAVVRIIRSYQAGTRLGIGIDADGLLISHEPGRGTSWMDAKVGDWVITPRQGRPVELNALWYNALRIVSGFLAEHGDPERAKRYGSMANQVRASFLQRYRRSESDHLADVVDGPDGDDWSVRPNQIFALSLPYPLIDGDEARAVLDAIARELLTDFGLRSLSPNDPAYRGSYGGDQVHRDGAYHQGPVWGWLLGPFVEASFRLHGDRDAALRLLAPVEDHLLDAGLGSISEIFEGDAPHRPDGCIAQAWSVAEVLRVWQMIDTPGDSRFPGDGR
jgi:predicted glycogen debranching enzyme